MRVPLWMLFILSFYAYAFDEASYVETDFKKYSDEKVVKVKKDRKENGTPENLGFSFNTIPGQKIRVQAKFNECRRISHASSNFLSVGSKVAINPTVREIAKWDCSLAVSHETYKFITQSEVAEFLQAQAKDHQELTGTAFLLYMGVSNERAVFLLNKFEPKN